MTTEIDRGDAAAVAAATASDARRERRKRLTLTNGIVLYYKAVPGDVILAASNAVKAPEVPRVPIPDTDRTEENPNDPAYVKALEDYSLTVMRAQLTTALLVGTEIAEVPDGLYRPEDDEWIDHIESAWEATAEATGSTVERRIRREPAKARYLEWLRLYAITDAVDTFLVNRVLLSGVSLSEEEVAAAAETFRRSLVRPADNGDPVTLAPLDGRDDREPVPGDGA